MRYGFRTITLALVILIAGRAATAATLAGVVRPVGGSGLKGSVRINLSRLGEPVAEQWLGADGRFRFDNVEPGPYDILVESFGYQRTSSTITVLGNDVDVVVELRTREAVQAKTKPETKQALREK